MTGKPTNPLDCMNYLDGYLDYNYNNESLSDGAWYQCCIDTIETHWPNCDAYDVFDKYGEWKKEKLNQQQRRTTMKFVVKIIKPDGDTNWLTGDSNKEKLCYAETFDESPEAMRAAREAMKHIEHNKMEIHTVGNTGTMWIMDVPSNHDRPLSKAESDLLLLSNLQATDDNQCRHDKGYRQARRHWVCKGCGKPSRMNPDTKEMK